MAYGQRGRRADATTTGRRLEAAGWRRRGRWPKADQEADEEDYGAQSSWAGRVICCAGLPRAASYFGSRAAGEGDIDRSCRSRRAPSARQYGNKVNFAPFVLFLEIDDEKA